MSWEVAKEKAKSIRVKGEFWPVRPRKTKLKGEIYSVHLRNRG